MDHTQIEALAHAIATQSVLDAWPYWVALLALVFLGVVIGSFTASYAAKRGEVQAARADRKEILEGLRETTKTAEEVRSAVSLEEWTERERRALRRAKLEEMILLAHKSRDWLEDEYHRLVDEDKQPEKTSPMPATMTLGSLYFPELENALDAFQSAGNDYRLLMLAIKGEILAARSPHLGHEAQALNAAIAVREKYSKSITERYKAVAQALSALEVKAAALMATIIAPPE